MSPKAKALNNLFKRCKVTIEGLKKAVMDEVITSEEFKEITGEDY